MGFDATTLTPAKFNTLNVANKKANDAYLKALDDAIGIMRKSVDEDFDLNVETLGAITRTFAGFQA